MGAELPAPCLKLGAQLGMVVDLAIIGDRIASIGREHRLVAARQIDDRQPAHAHAKVAIDMDTPVIRSAMQDRVAGARNRRVRNRPPPAPIPPRNPAHQAPLALHSLGRNRKFTKTPDAWFADAEDHPHG